MKKKNIINDDLEQPNLIGSKNHFSVVLKPMRIGKKTYLNTIQQICLYLSTY